MRYTSKLLLTALSILCAVAAINYVADPYGVFATVVDDAPVERPQFETNVRLAKARIVSGYRPEAVILGSSRAEIGLSPAHPGWEYERVYNLGFPHSSIQEIHDYLEHAVAAGELKQAVIALDFFQFNPILEPRRDFDDCRLRQPGSPWSALRAAVCDLPVLVLSRQALAASMAQLFHAAPESESVYLRDGSRNHEAKEQDLRRAGSQHQAFLRSEARYFNNADLLRGFLLSESTFEEVSGPQFESLLRLAHRHDVDLRILISPSHARQLELIHELGIWDEFVRWKHYLVATADEIAGELDAAPYPVWDFANYNRYSQEAVPPPDDPEARMQWYWESSHYTHALGEIVLSQVLAERSSGIGMKLDLTDFDDLAHGVEVRRSIYLRHARTELASMRGHLRSETEWLESIPPPLRRSQN